MTAAPPILGRIDEPSAERYEPQRVSEHCEAAKDLLLFLRNKGIRASVVEVGKDGVRLLDVVDDYPRKRVQPSREPDPMSLFEDDPPGGKG